MSIQTSQKITQLYNLYKKFDVTFNAEVTKVTGLDNKEIFLKCAGDQWSCIVYSSSMLGAKIIANIKAKGFEKIREANNLVSLRYAFRSSEKKMTPLAFFVAAKVIGFTPYKKERPDLHFINIQFTQKPPDDLITILGNLLEANINSIRRKDERIVLNADVMRRLGLVTNEAAILINNVPRKCIIRDLSFSSTKVILIGVAKLLMNKEALIEFSFQNNISMRIKGEIIRVENVEGHKELAVLAISFLDQSVPMLYKTKINEYFTLTRKTTLKS